MGLAGMKLSGSINLKGKISKKVKNKVKHINKPIRSFQIKYG